NPATVTVGGKRYTFHFVENPFDGVSGTGTEGVAKTLSVTVKNAGTLPNYQTYIDIASATSSIEFSEEKYPENGSYDGIISEETTNRWSAQGSGNWICYDFGKVTKLHSVAIAGYLAISRNYKYDIEASSDGVHFTKICEAATEPGANRSVFKLGDIEARYVRVTGTYTSNSGAWLGISEIRFYDNAQMEADDQSAWNHYFYTNSIYAKAGEALQLEIAGKSKSGQAVPIAIADVTLTSENPEIATVSPDGVVTLVKAGSTNIVAETITVLGNRIRTSLPVTVE
ncbi:MAG: discoidin domain-containing protein, partial [Clostridia bacterium]|nr:discoidin domain-containing protein [Clostridia bacterium]